MKHQTGVLRASKFKRYQHVRLGWYAVVVDYQFPARLLARVCYVIPVQVEALGIGKTERPQGQGRYHRRNAATRLDQIRSDERGRPGDRTRCQVHGGTPRCSGVSPQENAVLVPYPNGNAGETAPGVSKGAI